MRLFLTIFKYFYGFIYQPKRMNSASQNLIDHLTLNTQRFLKIAETLVGDEVFFRPYQSVNHFVWTAGHLAMVRNTMLRVIDPNTPLTSFENERGIFGPGSAIQPDEVYPDLGALLQSFEARGAQVSAWLATATDQQLDAQSGVQIPNFPTTVGGLLHFFTIHETEHFGEMKMLKNLAIRQRA